MQPNDAITPEFIDALKQVCASLNTLPEYLLPVLFFESGCMASSENASSSATGLIGFMGSNNYYGIRKYYGYTRYQFRDLPMAQQMIYVGKYLSAYKGKLNSVGNVYQAVFLPASLNYAKTPDAVVCGLRVKLDDHGSPLVDASGKQITLDPYGWAYRANTVFDKPDADGKRKNYITVQDITDCALGACKGPRWDEINQNLLQRSQ